MTFPRTSRFLSLASLVVFGAIAHARPASADEAWAPYGGFALTGMLEPFGAGTDMERHCTDLGAATCSTPMPIGGGAFGYVGMARERLGIEVFLGGLGDLQRPSSHFDGVSHVPHGDPLLSTPARDETFIILRGGGMIAARARYTWDGATWRPSVAAGIGLAYRFMSLEREVHTAAGLDDRAFFPTGTTYVSPALSLDASMQYRAARTTAFMFGIGIWTESAWSSTRSEADLTRTASGNGMIAPVPAPAYEMAHGLQIFVLPYVGAHFGP